MKLLYFEFEKNINKTIVPHSETVGKRENAGSLMWNHR
jgi:hypothetical protein